MKNKIIILTGMTGSGKSKFTKEFLKLGNYKLISADIQQYYSNFPILSNQDLSTNASFLSMYDINNDIRVNANDVKSMVINECLKIINEGFTPIIEGGSYFYINYLITENDSEHKISINNDHFDIRFFVFYYDKITMNNKLIQRCIKMIKEGAIMEVLDHYISVNKLIDKKDVNIPLGYDEIIIFLTKYNSNLTNKQKVKLVKLLIKDIVDKTRNYAGKQLMYMKKYFKDHTWVKINGSNIPEYTFEEINEFVNMPKEEYSKLKTNINLEKPKNNLQYWSKLENEYNNINLLYENFEDIFELLDIKINKFIEKLNK